MREVEKYRAKGGQRQRDGGETERGRERWRGDRERKRERLRGGEKELKREREIEKHRRASDREKEEMGK